MAIEDERAAKRMRYMSRVITIKVGAAKDELPVHENILVQDSAFFKAALEKQWKEGLQGIIDLPEDDIDTVTAYVHWLYRNEIIEATDSNGDPDFVVPARLYVFGEKIQSDALCNATLGALLSRVDTPDAQGARCFPDTDAIAIIYDGTPPESPIRKWLITAYAEQCASGWFEGARKTQYKPEFLADLALGLMEQRGTLAFKNFSSRKEQWEK